MSQTLTWRPDGEGSSLPEELKRAVTSRRNFPWLVTQSDRPYFEGLADAGIKGATAVLDALDGFDTIVLELQS
jgi:hypothetical protein